MQLQSDSLTTEVVHVQSVIGGGTAPTARLDSSALALCHRAHSCDELMLLLRKLDPPVIGYISGDRVLLDLRTVEPEFDAALGTLLRRLANDKAAESNISTAPPQS